MQIKSLHIGRLTTKNNVFLAPLAGFSDFAFRKICIECGCGLAFTEMVSAKGLKYNSRATVDLLRVADCESIKAVQLFGNDPQIMREACESEDLKDFDIVDINMGCPVPKVFNNGEGSALLDNVPLAGKIVEECVKSGKIITVKMRTGVQKGSESAIQLAKTVESAGAKMVTVHGRSREDYYTGEINFDLISKIKQCLAIPVICNGNVFSKSDADEIMQKTGADGVMIGRGALYDPTLFAQILKVDCDSKKTLINRHIDLLLSVYPPKIVAVNMRKQFACYLHGVRDGKTVKQKIFGLDDIEAIRKEINQLQFD